jgi:hypothetical protein
MRLGSGWSSSGSSTFSNAERDRNDPDTSLLLESRKQPAANRTSGRAVAGDVNLERIFLRVRLQDVEQELDMGEVGVQRGEQIADPARKSLLSRRQRPADRFAKPGHHLIDGRVASLVMVYLLAPLHDAAVERAFDL